VARALLGLTLRFPAVEAPLALSIANDDPNLM
jgi:hypothetical protein